MNPDDASEPVVSLRLERMEYQPGDELLGAFAVADVPARLRTLELSVLWYTEGKGDADLGVIHFEEWSDDTRPLQRGQPQAFTVWLPRTPQSYDGVLIKIHWCARVRARWEGLSETLVEEPFTLGPGHCEGEAAS